jgi:hypothetical protein
MLDSSTEDVTMDWRSQKRTQNFCREVSWKGANRKRNMNGRAALK